MQGLRDSPGGPVAETLHFQCRGPGLIPGQGTRPHMLQLKSLHATTKDFTPHKEDWRSRVPQLRPGAARS